MTDRTGKKHEIFRTPAWVYESYFKTLPEYDKVLDPSFGDGRMLNYMLKTGQARHGFGVDIFPKKNAKLLFKGIKKDFLQSNLKSKYDLVISNPPFSLVIPFIEKSIPLLKPGGEIIFIQRLNWLASLCRKDIWEKFNTKKVVVIGKRPKWELDNKKINGSATYDFAWFHFKPGYKKKPTLDWTFP